MIPWTNSVPGNDSGPHGEMEAEVLRNVRATNPQLVQKHVFLKIAFWSLSKASTGPKTAEGRKKLAKSQNNYDSCSQVAMTIFPQRTRAPSKSCNADGAAEGQWRSPPHTHSHIISTFPVGDPSSLHPSVSATQICVSPTICSMNMCLQKKQTNIFLRLNTERFSILLLLRLIRLRLRITFLSLRTRTADNFQTRTSTTLDSQSATPKRRSPRVSWRPDTRRHTFFEL